MKMRNVSCAGREAIAADVPRTRAGSCQLSCVRALTSVRGMADSARMPSCRSAHHTHPSAAALRPEKKLQNSHLARCAGERTSAFASDRRHVYLARFVRYETRTQPDLSERIGTGVVAYVAPVQTLGS